jgi:hypothetical protein
LTLAEAVEGVEGGGGDEAEACEGEGEDGKDLHFDYGGLRERERVNECVLWITLSKGVVEID